MSTENTEEEEKSTVDLFGFDTIVSAVADKGDDEPQPPADDPEPEPEVPEDDPVEEPTDDPEPEEPATPEEPAPTDEPETTEESAGFGEVFQTLADEGIVSIKEDVEYTDDIDGLKQIITESNSEAISEYKESRGDEAKQLLDILDKGGSVKDFININSQVDYSDKSLIEDENGNPKVRNLEYMIEDLLKDQGYEPDEIEEKLQEYKDNDLVEKEGKRAQAKLAASQKKRNAEKFEELEKERVANEQQAVQQAAEFKTRVTELKEIKGLPVSKKQAENLYDFITKPVGPNGETEFQQKSDESTQLLLAYFAMNGFNKDKLLKGVGTKQAIKLKQKLNNFKDTNAAPKASGKQVRAEDKTQGKLNIPWNM